MTGAAIVSTTFVLHADTVTVVLGICTFVATAALAAFTLNTALTTKRLAKATENEIQVATDAARAATMTAEAGQRQADVSEKSFASLIRPWLTITSDRTESLPLSDPAVYVDNAREPYSVYIAARLMNVGPGLALVNATSSWVSGYGHANDSMHAQRFANLFTSTPVVPSNTEFLVEALISPSSARWSELTTEKFCFPRSPAGLSDSGDFLLEVSCTDATGLNETRAAFHVVVDGYFQCRVFKIEYFALESTVPFATVIVGLPG